MTSPDTAGGNAAQDLESRAQIHDLVVRFYRRVAADDLLGPVFAEVAEVDWSVHIPTLIDFWCRALLGQPGYEGFLLGAHAHVHELEALTPELFDRWYRLFDEVLDETWSGPVTMKAKAHAALVGGVLSRRLLGTTWQPPTSEVSVGVSP